MKTFKFLVISVLVVLTSTLVYADWITDSTNQLAEDALEPLVGDFGAALGAGIQRSALPIGFPGIEAGVNVNVANISDDNGIISDGTILVPMFGAKLGLPKGIAVFAGGLSYGIGDSDENLSIIGFGARYSAVKEKTVPFIPAVSAVLGYHKVQVTDITITNISLGAVVSKKLPGISPYAGLSYNLTSSEFNTVAGTLKPSKNSFCIGAGVDIKPFPFVFLNAGISNLGWNGGVGLRFSL